MASASLAQDESWEAWLFLGAGVVLLLAAAVGMWHLLCSDSSGPMPAEISSVGLLDGSGLRRPGASSSEERRAGGRRVRCGDPRISTGVIGTALDRQKQKRTTRVAGDRRVRFAAPAADELENEDMNLLRNAVIEVEENPPKDLTAATEEERRVAVLESLQALERAQYEGHRKRVELTTQIELQRFWGPEATPRLIDEPVPLAL